MLALFATKASWENFETNNFETHILLDQKILKIEKTEASVEDGQITFNANLNFSAATPYLKGQLQLKSIPVKPDLLSIVPFYLNKGLASFSADFDAKGNSVDDMMHSLSAQGHFGIQKGVISGMNLQNFERTSQAMIVRADLNKNMATALQRSFFTGETPFEILEGSYAITNGLLRSTDGILNVPNANALLHVDFNLPQKTLSSSAAFSFKNLIGYPPLPLSIKGSIRNPQVNLDLTSFIKYIESSASDTKNEFIRRQREQEIERQQNEAQSRVQQISDLMLSAQKQLELAKKTIQLAPSETAEAQFIRATDAFILLEELSKKSTPSEADVSKAIAQASQIASRTQVAMDEVTERAAGVIRKDIADNFELAQQKMIGINRVYQRLKTVESITKAYQTANAALTEIQQINTVAQTATDVEKLQEASVTVQKDVDIIDSTYKNIQKYDIEANPFYDENTSMQGVITRN